MNSALIKELYERIDAMPIVDVHTHVDWKTGTAANIGEVLSYHYYTELTNSAEYVAGKFPFDDPEALTEMILPKLALIRNTVQYDWLMTISREYLGLGPDEWRPENWEFIFDRSVEVMGRAEWRDEMIAQSNIVRVFLTNQYNDDLEGLDPTFYSPCLRCEPFVVWMDRPAEREGWGHSLGGRSSRWPTLWRRSTRRSPSSWHTAWAMRPCRFRPTSRRSMCRHPTPSWCWTRSSRAEA